MKVRDLLLLSGSEARVAAFDRHASLHKQLRNAPSVVTQGLYTVTGTMSFVQYLIGGAIEGNFSAARGTEAVSYSATVWGPGVGCGVVKGAGAFARPLHQLQCPATIYVASDAEVLEVTWFDENEEYLGFFAGTCAGISVGAQAAAGAFTLPARSLAQ